MREKGYMWSRGRRKHSSWQSRMVEHSIREKKDIRGRVLIKSGIKDNQEVRRNAAHQMVLSECACASEMKASVNQLLLLWQTILFGLEIFPTCTSKKFSK
jgi:hypothetical protein